MRIRTHSRFWVANIATTSTPPSDLPHPCPRIYFVQHCLPEHHILLIALSSQRHVCVFLSHTRQLNNKYVGNTQATRARYESVLVLFYQPIQSQKLWIKCPAECHNYVLLIPWFTTWRTLWTTVFNISGSEAGVCLIARYPTLVFLGGLCWMFGCAVSGKTLGCQKAISVECASCATGKSVKH